MKSIIPALFIAIFALPTWALQIGETLKPTKIENQFGEASDLTAETQWVIFSSDMDASKRLTEYLNNNSKKVDLTKTLVISDISKMPSMIAKMFAIPKMKKYSYKLALDRDGAMTKDWPRKEGSVTVMKLSQLKVDSIQQLDTVDSIKAFFSDKLLP